MVLFGEGIYIGVALAALALLSTTWLRDLRRALALGGSVWPRFAFLFAFLFLTAALWPLGLFALWMRSAQHTAGEELQHQP